MSHFPETLKSLIKASESLKQQALSDASGVDRASISRFSNGQRFPVLDQLVRLVSNISTDRDRRLDLMIAYLRDIAEACHGAGFDARHYTIKAVSSTESTLGDDLEFLAAEAAKHADVRQIVEDLVKLVRRGADQDVTLQLYRAAESADSERIQKTDAVVSELVSDAEKRHRAKARSAS